QGAGSGTDALRVDREAPELHCTRAIRHRQNAHGLGVGISCLPEGLQRRLTTAAALVHELMEARDERRLRALQKHLNTVKLLIVDELGYVPFTAVGSELLFDVFSQRYERGSTLVTSNLPFDEWTSIFGSGRLSDNCRHGETTSTACGRDRYFAIIGEIPRAIDRRSPARTRLRGGFPAIR